MTADQKRVRTAYHEAGHAVIADMLFLNLEYVTIEPNDVALGHVRLRVPAWGSREKWRELIVLYAGVLAEKIYDPVFYDEDLEFDVETSDGAQLWASLKAHSDDENQQERWSGEAFRQCRKILGNPSVWRAVETLAERLLNERTIDWVDASETIAAALKSSKWGYRDRFQMGRRYAEPPVSWIESREEYRQFEQAIVETKKGSK